MVFIFAIGILFGPFLCDAV